MQLSKKWYWFVLALILGAAFLTTAGARASQAVPAPSSTSGLTLVQRANPYIHIVNYMATIDPAISQHLNTNEVKLVQNSVNHYNSLPLSQRQQGIGSGSITLHTESKARPLSGVEQWYCVWYWWGARCWVNSAVAEEWGVYGGIIATLIGGLIAGPLGAAVGLVVGVIFALGAAQPIYDDIHCGGRGAFIDIPWDFWQAHWTPVC